MKIQITLEVPNNITETNINYWLDKAFSFAAILNYRTLYNIKGGLAPKVAREVTESWSYTWTQLPK